MLELVSDVPQGTVGVKGIGTITRQDYERVVEPLFDAARRERRRLRFLYVLGPGFEGFTAGAAWEDAKVGLRSLQVIAACGVVTDHDWIGKATRIAAFFLPCPVKVFPSADLDKAIAWLGSMPHEVGVTHQLLPEKGVLVIHATHTLHAQDFDALAATADPWIESHGVLQGVVIQARAFPGWENLGTLIRHVQFVRNHHRKVKRLALVVDSKVAALAPRLGEHFIQAKIKTFEYDHMDAALIWASGSVS